MDTTVLAYLLLPLAAAHQLGVPLATEDRAILAAFPALAQCLAQITA